MSAEKLAGCLGMLSHDSGKGKKRGPLMKQD